MKSRTATVALFGAVLIGLAPIGASPAASDWPQAHSDIPADPAIVFGTLPNGMRYLIKNNTTPLRQISLRLRIAAGSLDETAGQGAAHFVEHMVFRGSAHFADGEIFKTLEGLGAGRGRDANAFTTADGTSYAIDLPVNDGAAVGKGLAILRDVADGAAFDAKAFDSEREVVLSEIRQGDVASLHASKAYLSDLFGAAIADAEVSAGTPDNVRSTTLATLQAFYRNHYRPDAALLVVVGDVEPKAMEAAITSAFSSWKAGPSAQAPDRTVRFAPGAHTTVFTENGAASTVALSWPVAHDDAPDTKAVHARRIVRQLALGVVNERLQEMARTTAPPFIGAGAARSEYQRVADVTSIGAQYAPGRLIDAVRALHAVRSDLLRKGVRQDEVDRAVANLRTSVQVSVAAAKTLPSANWAASALTSIANDQVFESPDEWRALAEEAVKDLRADRVTAVLRELFGAEPKVFVSSPTPLDGTEAAVADVFSKAATVSSAAAPPPVMAWPYTSFGTPAKATITQTVDDLGVTYARYPNGVRVTVKPTKLLEGQIFIHLRFGEGRLGFAKDRKSPFWALDSYFMGGGVSRITPADMPKVLAGREVNASFGIWDTGFEFRSMTRPADYLMDLQNMAAYLTDPAWRREAFDNFQSALPSMLAQVGANADGLFNFELWRVAHDNDMRWQLPTADDIRATRPEDVKALIADALASGRMEIVVVGDISVADALKGLDVTLGALPKRHVAEAPQIGDERQPRAQEAPIVLRHQGAGGQAVAAIAWPTTSVFPDVKRQRTQDILTNILSQRLFEELRTHDGMTYTPGSQIAGSLVSPGYGFVAVYANVPAQRTGEFYAAVEKVVAALKAQEVKPAELDSAREILVRGEEQAQQGNAYWADALIETQTDPRRLDAIRTKIGDLKAVTAADVLREARTYLVAGKSWKFLVTPKDGAVP